MSGAPGAGERARELIERWASQISTSTPGELWQLEESLSGALAAVRLEEARWWHTRVAMAALCDDQEVRGECMERKKALERAVEGK